MPVPSRDPAVQLTAISPQPPADVKCPRRRYYLINPSEKKQLDAGCSRWDCHFCARYKRRRLRKRLEQVRWRLMLTLTLSADCDLATQSAALGRFIRIARREWGAFKFVWVRELGERTHRLHAHMLIQRRFVAHAQLQAWCARAGLGPVVWASRVIDAHRVGSYVAKYMSKLDSLSFRAGTRRYQTRGVPDPRSRGWHFSAGPADFGRLPDDDRILVRPAALKRRLNLIHTVTSRPTGQHNMSFEDARLLDWAARVAFGPGFG